MTSGGDLFPIFAKRFEIDKSNKYDLIATMTNDTEQYCGQYMCIDNNNQKGENATADVSSKFRTFNYSYWTELLLKGVNCGQYDWSV